MPRAGLLNANEFRAYPLVAPARDRFPVPALVDFGCTVGPAGRFVSGQDSVCLVRVDVVAGGYDVEFRSNAEGLVGRRLVFFVPVDAAEFLTVWSLRPETSSSGLSASSAVFDDFDDLAWTGFLTVGRVVELAAGDGHYDFGSLPVEPALIQNLAGAYVTSLNLANGPRTVVTTPDGCPPGDTPDASTWRVCAEGITGDVVFREGFNCSIRVLEATNTIGIGGRVGAGEGEPCKEVPRFPDEPPQDEDGLLSGGPSCGDTVKGLNGIDGRVVALRAGGGIKIEQEPESNRLTVSVDWHGLVRPEVV